MAFEFLAGKKYLSCFVVTIKTPEGVFSRLIDDKSFTVGRSPDCVLSFPDPNISRTHCLITYKSDQLFVIDQSSSNGTFINGEKVVAQKMTLIKPTDLIKIGISELYLKVDTIEKVLKQEELAKSLLPDHEKNKLLSLIEGAQQSAQRMMQQAHEHTELVSKNLEQKTKLHDAELIQKQEAILAEAHKQAELIKQTGQKECDQIVLSAEQKAIEATRNVVNSAEQKREEAEKYYKDRLEISKKEAEEIIAKSKTDAQDHLAEAKKQYEIIISDAKSESIEIKNKIEQVALQEKQELLDKTKNEFEKIFSTILADIESKKIELANLEINRLQEIEAKEKLKIEELNLNFDRQEQELLTRENEIKKRIELLDLEYSKKDQAHLENYQKRVAESELDFKLKEDAFKAQILNLDSEYKLKNENFINQHNNLLSEKESEIQTRLKSIDSLKLEAEQLSKSIVEKNSEFNKEKNKIEQLKKEHSFEEARHSKILIDLQSNLSKSQADLSTVEQMRTLAQQKHKDLENKLVQLQYQIKDHEGLLAQAIKEYESQKVQLKKNLENDILQFKKERDENFRIQIEAEAEKVKKTKEHVWSELASQQADFVKQLYQSLSTSMIQTIPQEQFRKISSQVEKQIDSTVSQFLTNLSLNQNAGQVDLTEVKKKQKRQKMTWAGYGLATGLSVMFVVSFINTYLHENSVQKILEKEKNLRDVELQARRFEPEQQLEVKENYTNSVIYTKNFVVAYQDATISNQWFKAARDYLYEKWRVQEETSIEALAIAKTLVSTLEEKRKEIHPDFVNQNIEKMLELENETLKKLEVLLGTEVKVQAFKKFEKKFFDDAILKIEMGSNTTEESPERGLSSETE